MAVTADKPETTTSTDRSELPAHPVEFPEVAANPQATATASLNTLMNVGVTVTAELGRISLPIASVLKLGQGSIVELNRTVSEPIDLLVQGIPFAKGEVVVVEDRFAFRIREIIDPKFGKKVA